MGKKLDLKASKQKELGDHFKSDPLQVESPQFGALNLRKVFYLQNFLCPKIPETRCTTKTPHRTPECLQTKKRRV